MSTATISTKFDRSAQSKHAGLLARFFAALNRALISSAEGARGF